MWESPYLVVKSYKCHFCSSYSLLSSKTLVIVAMLVLAKQQTCYPFFFPILFNLPMVVENCPSTFFYLFLLSHGPKPNSTLARFNEYMALVSVEWEMKNVMDYGSHHPIILTFHNTQYIPFSTQGLPWSIFLIWRTCPSRISWHPFHASSLF